MNKELIDELKGERGKLLRNFLAAHYIRLLLLDNLKEYSKAQDQAIEVKATIKAVKILKDILTEITDAESFNQAIKDERDKLYI